MVNIKGAIRDLAVIAIGILVVSVVFEATGLALASLNSATASLQSYVNIASLAGTITTVIPIVNIVFIIAAIVVLLELFGADNLINIGT